MTPDQWDGHWFRIREDYMNVGFDKRAAGELADFDTTEQFGARPREENQ